MRKILFLLLFSIFQQPTKAEIIQLLDLPLSDGTHYTYSVNAEEKCSFAGVHEIITPKLKRKKGNILIENLNYFQRKLNLNISSVEFSPQRIIFSLTNATNISYEFRIEKPDCLLKKSIHVSNKTYVLDEVKIEYSSALVSPVVKKVIFTNHQGSNKNEDLLLYPWALRGQISSYELNLGPALSVHTNIRLNDQNKFQKNNPVVEPIPAFFFRYGPLFLNKNGLGSLVYHTGEFSVLINGLIEGEPYKGISLDERVTSTFWGGILKYDFFEFIFYKDFFKNKGSQLKLNFAPEYYIGLDWKLTPQVFIQSWSSSYVDYYFGVTAKESSSSGLRTFQGEQTLNYGTMFEAVHFIGNWSLVTSLGLKHYGKEVYSSPTVVRQDEVRFIASVLYKFF